MLKIKFLYSLLFLFMATVLFSSCRKDENDFKESPDDIILIINAEIDLRPGLRCYLVIENSESQARYQTVSHQLSSILQRKKQFVGNTINFHTIFVDELDGNSVDMQSYFDIPIGREIIINNDYLKENKIVNSNVNLSFANIPDFDLVSRTAKYPEQGYTLTSFETPATTAALGGETYVGGNFFYSCFQSGSTASYILDFIPNNTNNYTINFDNLSPNVIKYTFPKNINDKYIVHADFIAYNNPLLLAGVQIFNLDDFSIYPTSTFDIFAPSNKRELGYYSQYFIYQDSEFIYSNWAYERDIINMTFLEAGLKTTSQIGQLPIIEFTTDLFDEIEIEITSDNFSWSLHGPEISSFYIPNLPVEVSTNFPESNTLEQLFLNQEGGVVKLIDYTPLVGYEEILDLNLGITKLEIEYSFSSQGQVFSIK